MFERYTEPARRVIFFARYEASQVGAHAIEAEQILLGLLRENNAATELFQAAQVSAESVRTEIGLRLPRYESLAPSVDLPLSVRAKRVLNHAADESERLGHTTIGPEHLLIGILREEDSIAADVLSELGMRLNDVLDQVSGGKAVAPAVVKQHDPGPANHCNARKGAESSRNKRVGLFHNYTEKARRVIFFSRYEASQFGAQTIDPEHILLGLLREDDQLARKFLRGPHSTPESIRKEIEERTPLREKVAPSVDLPLSLPAKRVLNHAADESERLQRLSVGTEHLLLGILHEEESIAAQCLYQGGLRLDQVRDNLGLDT